MKLKAKILYITTKGPLIVIVHHRDANKIDLEHLGRIRIKKESKEVVVAADFSHGTKGIKEGEIGIFLDVADELRIRNNELVEIFLEPKPESLAYIKKKLDKQELNKHEIDLIIKDLLSNKLAEVETTYFVAACYINGMTLDESAYLAEAIVNNSGKLKFDGKKIIVDKHCLTPKNSILIKENGEVKRTTIGKLVNKFINKEIDRVAQREINEDLEVASFDKNFKVSFKRVKRVFKIPSPNIIYELILRGNKKIRLTGDHEVFQFKGGEIVKKPISECEKEEHVVIPRKIQLPESNKNIEINTKLADSWRYKKFNIKIKPTLEFARFLGYYVAEGFSNEQGIFLNFGSHEEELIRDSIECIEKTFGTETTTGKAHSTAVRVRLYSRNLKKVFDEWEIGDNAHNKRIPNFVFNLNKEFQKEFLKAYIAGDGYRRREYEIIIDTASKGLVRDLQYLLASLGVSCSLSQKNPCLRNFPTGTYMVGKIYYLYIQALELFKDKRTESYYNNAFTNLIPTKEIISFIDLENIGWEMRRRLIRQKYLTTEKLLELEKHFKDKRLKEYLEGGLRTLPIKEIRVIDRVSDYVYDLEVEDNHTFFAGDFPIGISNCVGGLAGNRTTLIIVPILAAADLTVPKTSTRSITSPSGTADTFEVLAPVSHSKEKIMEIIKKTNACMVWGGTLDLASADDKLIQLEKVLGLDPEGFLLASILAKKSSVDSAHILIDIPIGPEAKIKAKEKAKDLAKKFIILGKKLKMEIKVIITDGSQPIGNGIGPALEARDVLLVLQNKGPDDLKKKSVYMAGIILEMAGCKNGYKTALEILESGKAYKKMKEIIKAQGGNPEIRPENIKLGKYKFSYKSKNKGRVKYISNTLVTKLAKIAGAPSDKGAGVYLHKKVGDHVKKNKVLFVIYAESRERLSFALKENLKEVMRY